VAAAEIPLIGVWTEQNSQDDLERASLRWEDILPWGEWARLNRVIRQTVTRLGNGRRQRSELSQLREVIDLVPHFTFSYDRDGRLLIANRAIATAYNLSVDKAEGRTIDEILPVREEALHMTERAKDVFREGLPVHDECVPFTYGDGSVHLHTINLLPLPGTHPAVLGVAVDVTAQKKVESEIQQAVRDLRKLLSATVDSLSMTVEERDPYTAGHQSRVASLAVAIAAEMGLDAARVAGLHIGASLHDIGKLAIPSEILSKPGRIAHEELQLVKTHPAAGQRIIANIPFPWPICDMVLHHHERLDGSGYPEGLAGDAISLESRILAVCDVFEAIANHRPYRPALGTARAFEVVVAGRGTSFDGDVVDALGRVVEKSGNGANSAWEAG
jgi:PAS domain S-box-containing protein